MAKVHKLSVSLPKEMVEDIRHAVDSGQYATSSEVVREAVREWKGKQRPPNYPYVRSKEELPEKIAKGIAAAERGDVKPAEEVFGRLEAKYQALVQARTRQSLTSDLARLGLAPGDIVMVHASVRAVGPVFGGPDEIHHAVVDAVSPGGTMMMVTGCPDGFDDVGRGKFSAAEEAQILEHQPAFDPGATRADRSDGTLAEFFRSWPGTKYSDGVTMRIAARGAHAAWLTTGNVWNYPHGKGSPLEKLVAARGKVLLLGSDHDAVTLMHYAEHIADFPGKRIARYKVPMLRDGERVWLDCEEFDTSSSGCHANWPDRFFALIVDDFIARHGETAFCARGKVGGSDAVLLDAAALVDFAVATMIAVAGVPEFRPKVG